MALARISNTSRAVVRQCLRPTPALDKTQVPPSTFFHTESPQLHLMIFDLSIDELYLIYISSHQGVNLFNSHVGQARLMEFHSAMELTMIINVRSPEIPAPGSSEIRLG